MPTQTLLPVPQPSEPLAARLRPRDLSEYIGQDHIVGPGRLLRRAIEADQLSSLIFYGPPGTGKTTLARVIAGSTKAEFAAINAVLGGVKDIREAVARAAELRQLQGRRTILFVDEVHRFNKAQQDALLPWVENGTVVLVGATTENPYFEVNKALVSRSRVFQLRPLGEADLRRVCARALQDALRGYGDRAVVLDPEALEHLVGVANGDARALLNALELAVETTPPVDGRVHIDLTVAEESIQRRAVLYDKEGDAHFDTISAFIKSVRGGDPDAALYWLARMVYAGEDPRFIFRRLIILASEDIGLADPDAVCRVMACASAFDRIGMPEGRFPLAQATLYLATTAKSNSTMAFFDALDTVAKERAGDVPNHLKDGSRDKDSFGHGEGYLYPHAYRDHWVAQQYLPEALQGRLFYQPSEQGWEGEVGPRVARQREAQLAAMVEGGGLSSVERFTTGPDDQHLERWVQRAASRTGQKLGALRDALYARAEVERHHLVLDLHAGTGLLTWEALRRAPEGGTWAWCEREDEALALRALAERLNPLTRPRVFGGDLAALIDGIGSVRFDRIIGRDVILRGVDVGALLPFVAAGGRMVLVETLAGETQRLADLLPEGALSAPILQAFAEAEDAIYTDPGGELTRWTAAAMVGALEGFGGGLEVRAEPIPTAHALHISPAVLERWCGGGYGTRLAARLGDRWAEVEAALRRALLDRTVTWKGKSLLLTAMRVSGRVLDL